MVIEVAGALARIWVAFTGVGVVISVWRWFGGDVWIADMPVVVHVAGLSCGGVEEPVAATAPTLVCGSVSGVDVSVAGVDAGMRLLLAAGDVLSLIAIAVPGVVLAIACGQALKGVPFSRVVSHWLLIGAVPVLVAGLGGELLGDLGRTILANEIFPAPGADVVSTGIYSVSVSWWPICAAAALGALAAIFRHGTRLQRETAGLV
nr:hypothetical protein GCM10025699_06370 [Microbacterium flavescens]